MRNFGIMIPQSFEKIEEEQYDGKGAPIYRGCRANGPCACLGTCRQIIGYSQDPEDIERHKKSLKDRYEKTIALMNRSFN